MTLNLCARGVIRRELAVAGLPYVIVYRIDIGDAHPKRREQ